MVCLLLQRCRRSLGPRESVAGRTLPSENAKSRWSQIFHGSATLSTLVESLQLHVLGVHLIVRHFELRFVPEREALAPNSRGVRHRIGHGDDTVMPNGLDPQSRDELEEVLSREHRHLKRRKYSSHSCFFSLY